MPRHQNSVVRSIIEQVFTIDGLKLAIPAGLYALQNNMLYVALTRTSSKEYVNFCNISTLKPYIGHIYRYSYNDKSYIGSSKINVKDRQNEHRTGNNTYKFGNAIRSYGYSSFKFEMLETIKF